MSEEDQAASEEDRAAFNEILNRPLRCMSAEEHERVRRDILLREHERWCTELRNTTLDVLTGADLVAARRSFDRAATIKAPTWYEAKGKLQQFAQIHAWAVCEREGLPKRYQSEGAQIAFSFTRGVSWREWCHWSGVWSKCSDCKDLFRNPYWLKKHTCARPDDVESRLSE